MFCDTKVDAIVNSSATSEVVVAKDVAMDAIMSRVIITTRTFFFFFFASGCHFACGLAIHNP